MGDEERRRRRYWGGRGGCGCGCASLIVVLTVGLLLSAFNSDVGIGLSIRVPFTDANLTVAGSVGKKDRVVEALPSYARGRVASNRDFINQSGTLTIWVAEGITLVVLGQQEGAPPFELHVDVR